jgi:hypothetical protein
MKVCERENSKCTWNIYINLLLPHKSIYKMKNIYSSFRIQLMCTVSFIIDIYALKKVGEHLIWISFILGMAKVVCKYLEGIYGYCPRALCNN